MSHDPDQGPSATLPLNNIARVMRNAVAPLDKTVTQISDAAKTCVQECATEFISFVASEANDRCRADGRKAITGDDLLQALEGLGFENYVEPLRHYLAIYRSQKSDGREEGVGSSQRDDNF
eukprot:m.82946 g.82946  ORF g.82946 m.82946 type:complete len:121 (+) comp14946_c1_seq2:120-482(+)